MSDEPLVPRRDEEVAAEAAQPPVDPNAGKTVIVAGSPEHEALLKSYPNATSYGPDVVIVPAPEPEPVEEVVEEDEVERRRADEPEDEDRVED
jgi:hypothetical protein